MINVNYEAKFNQVPNFHVLLIHNQTQRYTLKGF